MSFKDDVAIKEQILRMDFRQAKELELFYNTKLELKPYEEDILALVKERLEKLERQNQVLIGRLKDEN